MSTFTRLLLIIVLSLMFVHPALAQEPTSEGEPTAVVTDAPTANVVTATPDPAATPIPPVDETPEEPARDRSETVLMVVLIVVGVLAVILGVELIIVLRPSFNQQHPFVQDFIRTNSTKFLDEMGRRASLTESKLDDEAVAEIRRVVLAIIANDLPPAVVQAIATEVARQSGRSYTTPSS